jgi:hypothetical protein
MLKLLLIFLPWLALMSYPQGAIAQITNVNQLRDVEPTSWAFEALRSLVERYGCLVGYPDRTFRGERALTRWEFAAGLNACLNTVERLVQEGINIAREDLNTLKRLSQDFEQELAALGARLDNLEERTAFLEDHQFSTTTKLKGIVVFALADAWSGDEQAINSNVADTPGNRQTFNTETFFAYRVRLNLDTSFNGQDRMRIRLQTGNVPNLRNNTGTDMARLSFDGSASTVAIDDLYYQTPLANNKLRVWIGTVGLDLDDVFDPINPFLQSSDFGALAREQRYNPVVYRGTQGAGVAFQYKFNEQLRLGATYLTNLSSADPSPGRGLFNGAFSSGLQLDWQPTRRFTLAATYIHNYQPENNVNLVGGTSSTITQDPFRGAATSSERFGLQANWLLNRHLNLNAWGGYALAQGQSADRLGIDRQGDQADIWTWNAALSLIDLGLQGSVFTLSGGLPPVAPYVEGSTSDRSRSYIIQAQYSYQFTPHIQLTPGFFVVLNPNNDDRNSAIWVGVMRTTFSF